LKPRTIGEEVGKPAERSGAEDPFGGAVSNPEKAKKQAEIQAQREAEASAKHKLTTGSPSPSTDKWGGGGGGGWRSQGSSDGGKTQSGDGEKYRFNNRSGGQSTQDQKYQRNVPNKDHGHTGNTFESLSPNNNRW